MSSSQPWNGRVRPSSSVTTPGGSTRRREIAQQLYVTEKTVEAHLGRSFAKLDVRSRRSLAGALAAEADAGATPQATYMTCDANGRNIGDGTSNEISLLGSSITPGETIRCYAIVR
jgi:Bacterial regulatory proteins, luxR family